MECSLSCQVCIYKFKNVFKYKKHIISKVHQQKMKGLFPNDEFKTNGTLPNIIFIDSGAKHKIKNPVVGLSLLTLCFSPESRTGFYLCHTCEQKCSFSKILGHVSSLDHYSNYINYTDPNLLNFSWIPKMDMRAFLSLDGNKGINEKGPKQLQLLHLPKNLLEKLELSTYSEVILALGENEKVLKLIEAFKPERVMIQAYQKETNRKHPLLGMQHLVECICIGPVEKRHYLCTLCSLTVAAHVIIKHVLSFDHIYWYFKVWHPSTLLTKECYRDYTPSFVSMMLDFSKQTEESLGTADMKQVSLEPAEFKVVNFKSYPEALKSLESIKKCSLTTIINPGNKLELRADTEKSTPPYKPQYKLRCQDCSKVFDNIYGYINHLSKWEHQKMLREIFEDEEVDGYEERVKFHLGLFSYVKLCLKKNQPAIGAALVVACVTTQVKAEPFYVCFACQQCFRQILLEEHFTSRRHIINTLMYENPWRLPFGWKSLQDETVLKSEAWKEEKERRPCELILKILDVPFSVFFKITPPSYTKVLEGLEQQRSLLKSEVPQCEMYSKLQQHETFPVVGLDFMVMYDVDVGRSAVMTGLLCLLCERKLSKEECHDHVFSYEHVSKFLNCFHPGSLNSNTDTETFLDLAKQAANLHKRSHIQVIYLDWPIEEPCSYMKAKNILASVKRKNGNGKLEPQITPERKLFPRKSLKVEQHVKTDGQSNGSTNILGVENTKKESSKETPSPNEEKSATTSQGTSATSSDQIKNANEMSRAVKQEPEETEIKESTGEKETCHNTKTDSGAEARIEKHTGSKDITAQLKNCKEMKRKRSCSISEKSQESPCPIEDVEREMDHKRPCLTSKVDSLEENPKMPNVRIKEEKEENEIESYTAEMEKGLSALLKCCCYPHEPIYLCESCLLKVPEKDIVSHVTGFDHQRVHLVAVDVNDDVYSKISKQNFQSVLQILKSLQSQQHSGSTLPSSLSPPCVKPMKPSVTPHAQHDSDYTMDKMKVVKMETDDAEDTEKSVFATTSSKMTEVLPQSSEDDKERNVKVLKPADKSVTCPTVFRRSEETSSRHVSDTCGSNMTFLPACSTLNDSRVDIIPNTSLKLSKIETFSKVEEMGALTFTAATSQHAVTCSQPTGTTYTSNASISNTKSTAGSAALCRPQENRTGASPRVRAASINSASDLQTESRVAHETTCKTTPSVKIENASKFTRKPSKTKAASPTTPAITAKKPKTSVKPGNVENPKAVDVKKSVGPNAPHCNKGNEPAAPHQATGMSARSKHKKPHAEPSQTPAVTAKMPKTSVKPANVETSETVDVKKSVRPNAPHCNKGNEPAAPHQATDTSVRSKHQKPSAEPSQTTASKTNLSESTPKVGVNELIVVSCKEKKQVYCQLCLVKIKRDSDHHLISTDHQYHYVKMKYPEWTAKPSEMERKLKEIVIPLAEAERKLGSRQAQMVKVKQDVYEELARLPEHKAVRCLKAIMRRRNLQVSSASPAATASASPCEVLSSDDGVIGPHSELPELSTCLNHLEVDNKSHHQTLLVQRPDMELIIKENANLTAGEPSRHQRLKGEGTESDVIQDRLQVEKTMETVQPNPFVRDAKVRVPTEGGRIQRSSPDSNLSIFLKLKGLDAEPIIGLGSVLECQGIAMETFFLCMSCRETLSHRDICQHMVSYNHQFNHMQREYPDFLSAFWKEEDLLEDMKLELLKKVAWLVSEREQDLSPKVIVLRKKLNECVRTAPFNEALKMLDILDESQKEEMIQDITSNHKQSVFVPEENSQQPNDQPVPEEFLPTEMPSVPRLEIDQREDCVTRQTQKLHLEKTTVVGDLNGIKDGRPVTPLDVNRSSLKDDSVISPLSSAGSHLSPLETCSNLSMQLKFTPPVSQYQRPVLSLHVKQKEELLESSSPSTLNPNVSQTLPVSPRNEFLTVRKRQIDTPVETLVRSCTSNPLEDSLPAKCAHNQQQPISDLTSGLTSESSSVHPAATSISLSHNDKDTGLVSGEQTNLFMDMKRLADLISYFRTCKSQNTSTSESKSKEAIKERWDSECCLIKSTIKKNLPSSSSFERMSSMGNPTDLGCEIQPVSPSGSSAFFAKSSSFGGSLITGNLTEVEAACAVDSTATTAKLRDPQYAKSVPVQNVFENLSQFRPSSSTDTSHYPGQILQPYGNHKTDSTGVTQLPIVTIVTERPKQKFGSCKGQRHNNVNRGHQLSFPTVPTASPSDFLLPSGGYESYSQVPNVISGHPGCASSEADLGYTSSYNPLVYTESLTPNEAYTATTIYPSHIYPQLVVNPSSLQFFGQTAVSPESLSPEMMQYYSSLMRR